ncbi:MAG TPA: EAL domain-containing protein [Ilumatobacteraceae bacterium]
MINGRSAQTTSIDDAIRGCVDPAALVRRVVEQAMIMIEPAQGAALELLHRGKLTSVGSIGLLTSRKGRCDTARTGLAVAAISTRTTQRCDDTHSDPRVNAIQCKRLGVRSLLCVPLVHGEEAIGVLKVCSPHVAAFDDEAAAILDRLASFVSSVIVASEDLARATNAMLAEERHATSPSASVSTFVANIVAPGMVSQLEGRQRIEHVIATGAFNIVFQPILDLVTMSVIGFEALSRFTEFPLRSPEQWFAEAQAVGLGIELELATARRAIALLDQLPRNTYLAVNVGPQLLADPRLLTLGTGRLDRIVFEITEHSPINDYALAVRGVERVRMAGARLAIDDTGSGFASLSHILRLKPDLVKLDRELTVGVETDPVRRSLATALVSFCRNIDASIIAEGIENQRQLSILTDLGIGFGQGFHLGRPAHVGALATTIEPRVPLHPSVSMSTRFRGSRQVSERHFG